ncbi:hypothetical protein [Peptostreptococcus faecalis]|uniref:hypothetical protein n=1 Tax=Peptostreptococcus faecalis TaxID=2045015 RepID=UPI000C796165|nr:hypothetical protein [Peptostreptococcus faecalis]
MYTEKEIEVIKNNSEVEDGKIFGIDGYKGVFMFKRTRLARSLGVLVPAIEVQLEDKMLINGKINVKAEYNHKYTDVEKVVLKNGKIIRPYKLSISGCEMYSFFEVNEKTKETMICFIHEEDIDEEKTKLLEEGKL